jgi:uncharacterized protein with PQ loop repeat
VLVVLGAVASFFSLSATVPQVLRALRHRSAEGVSWSSLLLSLATFVLWCVYAAAVTDRVQLVNNAVAFCLLLVLAWAVLRARGAGWSAAGGVLGTVLLTGIASVVVVDVLNAFVLAMFGTVVSTVRLWPQTRLAVSRAPLWGLDPWATALAWVGCMLWTLYGVGVGDHALAISSVTGLAMQSTIMAFRLPPRRTLHVVAGGRLGRAVARVALPVSGRFPLRAVDFELVA